MCFQAFTDIFNFQDVWWKEVEFNAFPFPSVTFIHLVVTLNKKQSFSSSHSYKVLLFSFSSRLSPKPLLWVDQIRSQVLCGCHCWHWHRTKLELCLPYSPLFNALLRIYADCRGLGELRFRGLHDITWYMPFMKWTGILKGREWW